MFKIIRNFSIIIFCAIAVTLVGCTAHEAQGGEQTESAAEMTEQLPFKTPDRGKYDVTKNSEQTESIVVEETSEETPEGFYEEGFQFLVKIDGRDIISWCEGVNEAEIAEMFDAYHGEKIQRITPLKYETYSPAVCPDIVFYQAEPEETLENAVVKMIDEMILPLMEPSDQRPFTITEYKIIDQEILPLKEHMWILPILDGYYSYEGIDLVDMETRKQYGTLTQDGLVSFERQGSSSVFAYILLENNGVYRLQRAADIIDMKK